MQGRGKDRLICEEGGLEVSGWVGGGLGDIYAG